MRASRQASGVVVFVGSYLTRTAALWLSAEVISPSTFLPLGSWRPRQVQVQYHLRRFRETCPKDLHKAQAPNRSKET